MIRTTWMLLRIITNPRIMRTPLRVMRELQRRGTPRLGSVMDAHRVQRRRLLPFLRTWLRTELLSRHRGQWVVNSFVPPFPGAAFNRLFENALSGRRLSPVSAYLGITADCPYHCWHCSARNRRIGPLSTQHWLSVIAELHALGCSSAMTDSQCCVDSGRRHDDCVHVRCVGECTAAGGIARRRPVGVVCQRGSS